MLGSVIDIMLGKLMVCASFILSLTFPSFLILVWLGVLH